jgi:hypothetical protein
MKAYGIDGIPHAFVIGKDGTILWNGHPMGGLEEALQQIAAGTYDIKKAKKLAVAQSKLEEFVALASQDDKDPKLEPLGKELEALDKELGGIQHGEKFEAAEVLKMIRFQKAVRQYGRAVMAGESQDKLDELGKELQANGPKDFKLADFKQEIAARKAFGEYFQAAAMGEDKDKVAALAQKVETTRSKDPQMLSQMASALMTDENLKTRDYALATDLAKAAVDASGGKDAGALDMYAQALFGAGKAADAVTWEKKAVAAASTDDERQELQASLKKYQDAPAK